MRRCVITHNHLPEDMTAGFPVTIMAPAPAGSHDHVKSARRRAPFLFGRDIQGVHRRL